MGNQISMLFNSNEIETTKLQPASVRQIIDYIATHYILTMDFQSLKKLYDILDTNGILYILHEPDKSKRNA